MSRHRTTFFGTVAAVMAAVVALMAGCGSESSGRSSSAIDFGKTTVASCLRENNAVFAESTGDLEFFSEAEAEETASKFGFFYDESAKLFIELWEDGDDPREWLMWSAQPFEDDESPSGIMESGPSNAYVAFILEPSPSQRRSLKACTA